MTTPTNISNAFITWITGIAPTLVPSFFKGEQGSVTCYNPTAGRPVNVNAGDGSEKALKKFFLPNTLTTWPWPPRLNPHHAEASVESSAWIRSFTPFSPKAQESFDRCHNGLLGGLAYPTMTKEHARIVCDYMNATYVIDEYTDVWEEREVRKQMNIIMDALRNPHKERPEGEWIGGEIIRQFWERTMRSASTQTQRCFITAFNSTLESVVQQAIDRSGSRIRDIKSYIDMRRNTGGVRPAIILIELGLDIPDEVLSHPTMEVMITATCDMLCLSNDMASYNVEQARGDDHNIVALAMHEFDTDINGAMLWVANLFKETEKRFLEAMTTLPEWGEPVDSQVKKYCDGLGSWVRGNDEWNFKTERYFGSKGLEIKKERWITLLPKISMKGLRETGPLLVDSLM